MKLPFSAYVTNDLDICYSRDRNNLTKLALALVRCHPRPRGFPDGLPLVWDTATLTTQLGIIDLLAEVAGVGTYEDV